MRITFCSLVYILEELKNSHSKKLIFSSSCTVYGQADKLPIAENSPIKEAESPYGNTKIMGEQIIKDCCKANHSLKAIILRYFNPIGAHSILPILVNYLLGYHRI